MPINFETQKQDDYLVFTVTGTYNLNEAIDKFPLVIATCRQMGVSKALIDYRSLAGDIPTTLDFLYTIQAIEFYKTHLSAGGAPIKFVFLGSDPKPWPLGEEIAKSYGMEVLVTYDFQKAVEWFESNNKAT